MSASLAAITEICQKTGGRPQFHKEGTVEVAEIVSLDGRLIGTFYVNS